MQGMQAIWARQVTGVEVEQARDSIAVMKPQEIDYTSTLYAASVEIAFLRKVTARRMKLIQDVFNADGADELPGDLKRRMAAEFDGFETPNVEFSGDAPLFGAASAGTQGSASPPSED